MSYTMDGFRKDVKNAMTVTAPLYRVRKSWSDAKSQIGAYASLPNAQAACYKAGVEYCVFDASGNIVYPLTGYKVKVITDALNIRAGAGTNYKINGCIKDQGVYTIVETKNGWGKLKSGQGWICLQYAKRI